MRDVKMAAAEGTFTLRASQSFIHAQLSGPVVTAVIELAPKICLRFEADRIKMRNRFVMGWWTWTLVCKTHLRR